MVFVRRRGISTAQAQALIDAETAGDVAAAIAAAVTAHNTAAHDPVTLLDLSDDFVSGGNTTGIVGSLGWSFVSGSITMLDGEANHPGIVRRDTGSSISTVAYMPLRASATVMPLLASASFDLTAIFRLTQADTDTTFRIGLSASWVADAPVSAIYLEKKAADTSFFGAVRGASTESRTAALGTADTGWHKVQIRRLTGSSVGFSFDGGAEVTLATNVPSVGLMPGNHIINGVASSKTFDLDLYRLRVTGITR